MQSPHQDSFPRRESEEDQRYPIRHPLEDRTRRLSDKSATALRLCRHFGETVAVAKLCDRECMYCRHTLHTYATVSTVGR